MTRPPHVGRGEEEEEGGGGPPASGQSRGVLQPGQSELGLAGHPCHMTPEGRVARKNQEEGAGRELGAGRCGVGGAVPATRHPPPATLAWWMFVYKAFTRRVFSDLELRGWASSVGMPILQFKFTEA